MFQGIGVHDNSFSRLVCIASLELLLAAFKPYPCSSLPPPRLTQEARRRHGLLRAAVGMAHCMPERIESSGVSSNEKDIRVVRRGGWRRVCRCRCEGWCAAAAMRRLRWRGASISVTIRLLRLSHTICPSVATNKINDSSPNVERTLSCITFSIPCVLITRLPSGLTSQPRTDTDPPDPNTQPCRSSPRSPPPS
jgi:hypothetical protein